jgi:hypothetical protein
MPYKKIVPPVLLACLFGLIVSRAYTQSYPRPKKPFNTKALYNSISAIKFPKPSPPLHGYLFMATLHYFPSIGTESQINLVQNNDGRFDVVQYSLPPGTMSIDGQLTALYLDDKLDPNQDPAELAKRFRVDVRNVSIPSEVLTGLFNQLYNLRFPSIILKPSKTSIVSDGPRYDLWYSTTLGEVQFSYSYSDYGKGDARALADWMDRVKKAVDSAK